MSLRTKLERQVDNIVVVEKTDSTHAMARTTHREHGRRKPEPRHDRHHRRPTGSRPGSRRPSLGIASRGLYLSWLRSGLDPGSIATLPVVAGAAAHAAITAVGVTDIRLKWPNDVLVSGRKLAGLIVHARHGEPNWVTVGLGVNLGNHTDHRRSRAPFRPRPFPNTSTRVTWNPGGNGSPAPSIDELDRFLKDPASAAETWRGLFCSSRRHRSASVLQTARSSAELWSVSATRDFCESILTVPND